MVNADAPYMKYADINIQIEYPNKLINADTPSVFLVLILNFHAYLW